MPQPARPWRVRSAYQPIVDLGTSSTIGYEALARGRPGSALTTPTAMFAAARASDDVAALEWACQAAAIDGVLDVGLAPGTALFMNAEPSTFGLEPSADVREATERLLAQRTPVVVEVTERELAHDPHALFDFRDRIRRLGWMLAVDDVGATPASLAMLPLLDPDVIKLDLALVQQHPTPEVAAITSAVSAHAVATGATVLAEGIETTAHLEQGRSFGATLGQGWLLGRPAPLPTVQDQPEVEGGWLATLRQRPQPAPDLATPWALVEGTAQVRTAGLDMLRAISEHLESQAVVDDQAGIVLTAMQDQRSMRGRTVVTYDRLAGHSFFVGVLGHGLSTRSPGGPHVVDLHHDDPLSTEWTVAVVTSHFAAALIAIELDPGAAASQADRRFDYVLTYDRALALRASRTLMRRFTVDADRTAMSRDAAPAGAADTVDRHRVVAVPPSRGSCSDGHDA